MKTESRLVRVFGPVRRNEAALSDVAENAFNLSINLSGEASICRKDPVYTKSKSELVEPLTFQVQVTVADHKERGIPKV